MSERISKAERSRVMAAVRSGDTKPEIAVRRMVHRLGYRFRLHASNLPGRPDLVFKSLKCVIFVNGCFWHRHICRRGRRTPQNNRSYWLAKFERNQKRDRTVRRKLRALGWRVLVVWECEVLRGDPEAIQDRLSAFLSSTCTAASLSDRQADSSSARR